MRWTVRSPEKLIRFLEGVLSGHSGKLIRRMLDANLCRVNKVVERFGSRMLKAGDQVELASSAFVPSKEKQIETVYEDDAILIIDKPVGLVSSPEAILKAVGPNLELVHRLDKGTTGLLILAKSHSAFEHYKKLFKERKVQKRYIALVDGYMKEDSGVRKSFFVKKGKMQNQTIWGSSPTQGLYAETHFKVLKKNSLCSLVSVTPVTGRTHQIRVHMAEMGHPVIVDPQYARNHRFKLVAARPLLHAYELSFEGKKIRANLPEDLKKLISQNFPDNETFLSAIF